VGLYADFARHEHKSAKENTQGSHSVCNRAAGNLALPARACQLYEFRQRNRHDQREHGESLHIPQNINHQVWSVQIELINARGFELPF
jgi:hypothetical protein